MGHPNESFLRQFLGTEKEYQAKQKAIKRKQEVAEFFERKNNKNYVLKEEQKKSIAKTIEKVYKPRTPLLVEQKSSDKNWKPVNTPYGIYYYNKEQNLWMNNFGVVKNTLAEFIQVIDYGSMDGDSKSSSTQIASPSNLQVTVLSGGVGDFNIEFTDNSTDEVGFAIYITEVS